MLDSSAPPLVVPGEVKESEEFGIDMRTSGISGQNQEINMPCSIAIKRHGA
jgi:hypothetical protein